MVSADIVHALIYSVCGTILRILRENAAPILYIIMRRYLSVTTMTAAETRSTLVPKTDRLTRDDYAANIANIY